jgi:glutamine synthetase
MHGGDRNRTSPFAFTGNKFEFRAVGSSASLAFPNTVLNTIVAEAIDDLADKVDEKVNGGTDLNEAITAVVREAYSANKQIIFGGDNYDEAWHAEAEKRGLKNLKTTPDALPEILADTTIEAFGKYEVLSERELESRYEVWLEQYITNANIEAETAAAIAKTMILPSALRHLQLGDGINIDGLNAEVRGLATDLMDAIAELDRANAYPDGVEGLELAEYARDKQIAAMAAVREVADKLEGVVADDLWPLPKYSEILFVR